MDYKEEQEQELEVLRSIYPDELEVVKEYPGVKFELQLKLELQELIDTSHLSKDHTLHCTFQLPEEYPDVNPVISIDVEETLLNSDDEGEGEDEDEDEQQYDEHGNRLMSKYENIPDTISIADYVSESFLGWRTKFRQEHGLDKRDEERRFQAHHGRLTGKQMFEQGIEGTLDDIDDTDVQEVATKLQDDL
ncbi:Protein GIR2 [Nakaseomyces glabratus]|nr:Protein GIR2 [Nakaseomyces glabratus]KTB13697.1 Protein GIR2 [Nakaseomyces glabratus]